MPTGSHSERMKLEGILQYAHEKSGARWNLELDLGGILRKLVRGAARTSYDGIIAYVGSDAERKSLLAINLPLVLIEDLTIPAKFPRRRNVVTLLCDHEAEGRTAANYFLERQYRNFAYVGAEVDSDYNALRRKGFADAVRVAGFAVSSFSGATPLPDWLKSLPKPCALFAVHDLRARKVLAATEQAQVAVPSELAVLGVDDDAVLCTTSSPTLSSIPTFDRSLGYAAGRALNEILLKRARGRVIRTRHTQVVTRHSTDTEAISDIFVAKALDWARCHLGEKLTAEALARIARRIIRHKIDTIINHSSTPIGHPQAQFGSFPAPSPVPMPALRPVSLSATRKDRPPAGSVPARETPQKPPPWAQPVAVTACSIGIPPVIV